MEFYEVGKKVVMKLRFVIVCLREYLFFVIVGGGVWGGCGILAGEWVDGERGGR